MASKDREESFKTNVAGIIWTLECAPLPLARYFELIDELKQSLIKSSSNPVLFAECFDCFLAADLSKKINLLKKLTSEQKIGIIQKINELEAFRLQVMSEYSLDDLVAILKKFILTTDTYSRLSERFDRIGGVPKFLEAYDKIQDIPELTNLLEHTD